MTSETQVPLVRKTLAKSGNKKIQKAYEDCSFWGIGNGNGQNIIGKLWMQIRDEHKDQLQKEFDQKGGNAQ